MVETSQYASTTKYIVKAHFEVQGVVEKPDVVGAVFGQTEGLFGPDLDLRELQKNGRIGRIEINLESKKDLTTGAIVIPSSLDKVSTAIIAAAIESVDRIGPCEAKNVIELNATKVPDTIIKLTKDKEVTAFLDGDRAGDLILKELQQVADIDYVARAPYGREVEELTPKEVLRLLRERVPINQARPVERSGERQDYQRQDNRGPQRPEGSRERPSFERRGPPMRDRERDREREPQQGPQREPFELPPQPTAAQPIIAPTEKVQLPAPIGEAAKELRGTLEARIFDETGKEVARIPVSELAEKIPSMESAHTVVFDGVVTQRLLDLAASKNVKFLIGDRVSDLAKKSDKLSVMTMDDIAA